MNPDDTTVDAQLNERFQQLPKVVQDAIKSADVEKHLRTLAETHKLHLDQWQLLENEVMLTLLGFQEPEELQDNLKSEVGVDEATAVALASDISSTVFQPIREELERQLEHPEAKAEQLNVAEEAKRQILQQETTENTTTPTAVALVASSQTTVAPGTPPAPAPEQQAVRTTISDSYKTGEASNARKDVHNDPYRESPV